MRDKQIEEMTNDLCDIDCKGMKCNACDSYGCEYRMQAEALYDAGYRKASEVAREIAEEILDMANVHGAGVMFWHKMQKFADALKKKYTEEQ